jgi:HEAT repeat protein
LIETLKDNVPMVRMAAAEALGEIGPAAMAAIPALTEALTDPSWMVQASAAWALVDIGPTTDDSSS